MLSSCHFYYHKVNVYVQVEFSLKRNKSRKFLYEGANIFVIFRRIFVQKPSAPPFTLVQWNFGMKILYGV